MFWRQPFVVHICVRELDIFVTHGVVELYQNFHFGVINGCAGLFLYTDLKSHVLLGIGVGCFRGFDLTNSHHRAFPVAADILGCRDGR